MTIRAPLRFRRLGENDLLFADETGTFFRADDGFLDRLTGDALNKSDELFLHERGLAWDAENDLNEVAFLYRLSRRLSRPAPLSYVILVPTLRCDLSCSYCQVSRAALGAVGYDMSDSTLCATLDFLDRNVTDGIQVEFQGGEPTLRLDLVSAVVNFCRTRFADSKFVICTNLSTMTEELEALIEAPDVFVSTSLDGPTPLHQSQRGLDAEAASRFEGNLRRACQLAPGRVHALPTLNPDVLPSPGELLDAFEAFGIYSIYLRQITYHGFARKRFPASRNSDERWRDFHRAVVSEMITRNAISDRPFFEEYYLNVALRRLMRSGQDNHVDLRSPNWLGYDHLVIDHDGTLYPTDEARMLARSRKFDLSIGTAFDGVDEEMRDAIQGRAFNALDPTCAECTYQAACGSDPIDDIARWGRADPPRHATSFCQRHLQVFDFAIDLLYSEDAATLRSVAAWLDVPHSIVLGDRLK